MGLPKNIANLKSLIVDAYCVEPFLKSFVATISVPGDKSISHRAIMLTAIAEGCSDIVGLLESDDVFATLNAIRSMGVRVDVVDRDTHHFRVYGVGLNGLKKPNNALIHLGNSGTSMRLLAGIMVGQQFDSVLIGDDSLNSRPMGRIVKPLRLMGADIQASAGDCAPLVISKANSPLNGIEYRLPVASAQLKSCLLLAGLYAEGKVTVVQPTFTRDHTENVLKLLGYPIEQRGLSVSLSGGGVLKASTLVVPGDISSAAFFIVAATIIPGSKLRINRVNINPTRTGIVNILNLMGANIEFINQDSTSGEPVADIVVSSAELKGVEIPKQFVVSAIDEFPIIFIAAAFAEGTTILRHAKELRVKETDRIKVMAEGLEALSVSVQVMDDGLIITGGDLSGGIVDSGGDHRIAMAFAIAGLKAKQPITIKNCSNIATSFPDFPRLLQSLGGGIYPVQS